MKPTLFFFVSALAIASASGAIADESTKAAQSRIDLAFGVAATSDYISRGATQTDGQPALQGYVEASYNIFYLGTWASNVSFGGAKDVEIDIYGGIRPEFGDLSLDLGYAHYYYPKDPTIYGEFYAKGSYAVNDMVSPGLEFYFDPHNKTNWSAAKVEVSGLPWETVASGRIGSDFGTQNLGYTRFAWDAGISKTFMSDTVKFDLRYHDANDNKARIAAMLSFDFSTPLTPAE